MCACGPPKAVQAKAATSFRNMIPRTRRVRRPRPRGGLSLTSVGGGADGEGNTGRMVGSGGRIGGSAAVMRVSTQKNVVYFQELIVF